MPNPLMHSSPRLLQSVATNLRLAVRSSKPVAVLSQPHRVPPPSYDSPQIRTAQTRAGNSGSPGWEYINSNRGPRISASRALSMTLPTPTSGSQIPGARPEDPNAAPNEAKAADVARKSEVQTQTETQTQDVLKPETQLPPLTPEEFRVYNRLAEQMEVFV